MSFICMKTGSTPTAYRAHELPVFLSHERCMPIVERVLFSIDQTRYCHQFDGYLD